MGIAFIGAVVGHVDRVLQGASEEAILDKVRAQIVKKFGGKGDAVVEGNMAVIREGMEATRVVDYDAPEFLAIDEETAGRMPLHSVSRCRPRCADSRRAPAGCSTRPTTRTSSRGRSARAPSARRPVLPGIGLFMPAGTAAGKDKGLFRRTVPEFDFDLCTGCMECALVCPDAAIPNTVHEIHDLLLTGIKELDVTEPQREALRGAGLPAGRAGPRGLPAGQGRPRRSTRSWPRRSAALDVGPAHPAPQPRRSSWPSWRLPGGPHPARSSTRWRRPTPGTGGLFSATIDPWKCTGCLECIEVCGPGALTAARPGRRRAGRRCRSASSS